MRIRQSSAASLAAIVTAACSSSMPLLPPTANFGPKPGHGTVIAQPMIAGCAPTAIAIARPEGSTYKVVERIAPAGSRTGGRAVASLPPGTYHITGASCIDSRTSTTQRVYAPYPKVMFHLTEPAEFTGSLATFTVADGEIVDIGGLWFDRPSATSDQGSVMMIAGDASTLGELVKERPELAGRVVQRAAVAIPRTDLPKS